MIETILGLLMGILKAIPIFDRWFKKPLEQKIEEGREQIQDGIKKIEDEGRP